MTSEKNNLWMKDMEETLEKGAEGVNGDAVKLSGKRTVSRHLSGEPQGTEGAISGAKLREESLRSETEK